MILHIGPNDGAENEAAFYQLLVGMAQETGMELRLIFLEPLPSAAATLRRRLYRFLGNQSVEVLTAAVCPTGTGTAPVLYTLSREVPPETSSTVASFFNRGSYLSSLSWERFHHSLREFADFSKRRDSHLSRKEQQEIDALLKTQILSIPVRCPSVFGLLEELQLDISDLGLLIIDAEGVDTMLLQDFLSLPSFKPSVVQWEYVHSDAYPNRSAYRNATFRVVQHMAARGYDVMALMGDMVAVLPDKDRSGLWFNLSAVITIDKIL